MLFTYKAIDTFGKTQHGTLEAESESALYDLLKEKNLTLILAQQEGSKGNPIKRFSDYISRKTGRVKEEEKIQFAQNLGAMLAAGLPVARALSVMTRQTKNLVLKDILAHIQELIKGGESFNKALAKHPTVFSSLFVAMVEAGEESGKLSETLRTVAAQMDRSYKLKKKVKGAMIYPAVVLSAMIIIAILMLIFVVPTLSSTFIELKVELPTSTKVIIAISTFLKDHTVTAIGLLALFSGALIWFSRTPKGRRLFHTVSLKLPVIGTLVKETNAARTTITLSSLLASGVDVVRSIEIAERVLQNTHYKAVLVELKEKIQQGTVMSEVFRAYENLYPAFVGEMILVGEETGSLPELLERVGTFYEDDVKQKTQDLSTIIEPILMIIIGAGVGFFALSMISPMYSITSGL